MYSRRREIRAGSEIFCVRGAAEIHALDEGCLVLRADARQSSVRGREVRLARLDAARVGDPLAVARGGDRLGAAHGEDCAGRWRTELKVEARLHDVVSGLPRVVFRHEDAASYTYATGMPPGVAVTELHGRPPLPGRVLHDVLRGIVLVGRTLEGLHETGRAHRALRPEVLLASRDRMWLRDAGLAATRPEAGEGTDAYRAPEQMRAGGAAASDVYQLAAIVYHLVTGEAPGADPLPVARLRPDWGRLDEPLAAALHPDPERRSTIDDLIRGLTRADG
ncbi:hypothetical protein Q0Z83_002100 [Actinoplanes sichuanensis]|uniref:non-specific serine/threonine protein kinase n=2 Tax=Actinoplanes sichuanensis TaxID=512349 RepID=A0ABW4ASU0_9ACTN|nr:hypothetical protein [Actinoplanes sichuanensis]BEL02019.1 hypothetical protein Q0Z83_002100 [Actinoplanes sichuanensis]